MTGDQRYALAYSAAHGALAAIGRPVLRDVLAEAVAACVIGKGDWPRERYAMLADDDHPRRALVVKAAMRDLPDSVTVSSGPADAAVKAAAEALRDAPEQDQA